MTDVDQTTLDELQRIINDSDIRVADGDITLTDEGAWRIDVTNNSGTAIDPFGLGKGTVIGK